MTDPHKKQRSEADAALEREILEDRKFSLEEAVARMVGPGATKGASPVARMQQAELEIGAWLRSHLGDSGGALEVVLLRHVKGSEALLRNYERPLSVLQSFCQRVLDSDYLLKELVRTADVEWGQMMDERPHFEIEGSPHDPEDPYTVDSVRRAMSRLLELLAVEKPPAD